GCDAAVTTCDESRLAALTRIVPQSAPWPSAAGHRRAAAAKRSPLTSRSRRRRSDRTWTEAQFDMQASLPHAACAQESQAAPSYVAGWQAVQLAVAQLALARLSSALDGSSWVRQSQTQTP